MVHSGTRTEGGIRVVGRVQWVSGLPGGVPCGGRTGRAGTDWRGTCERRVTDEGRQEKKGSLPRRSPGTGTGRGGTTKSRHHSVRREGPR